MKALRKDFDLHVAAYTDKVNKIDQDIKSVNERVDSVEMWMSDKNAKESTKHFEDMEERDSAILELAECVKLLKQENNQLKEGQFKL